MRRKQLPVITIVTIAAEHVLVSLPSPAQQIAGYTQVGVEVLFLNPIG